MFVKREGIIMKKFLIKFKNGSQEIHLAEDINDVYIYYLEECTDTELKIDSNIISIEEIK